MKKVRTRFAPSPTGNLHIGGARTALFAYLWAHHNTGEFILRVEDTDKVREVPGSQELQQEGLRWLGIEWTEGPDVGGPFAPYKQSERLDLYTKSVQVLLESGKAYYCFCTTERLTEMREQQQRQKLPPQYDRTCRRIPFGEAQERATAGEQHVVRLAVPETDGAVTVHDAIRGELSFEYRSIDDQVLIKSDGYPTYHLANVVDDHDMQITHVIRGQEWIPSTPKHVLLYEAFGWEAPVFAHLTIFLSKHGGKMSKRDGETALLAFRDLGYLPEAVVNFSALLGWNPKTTEEIFSLDELIQRFELSMINTGNPVFETEKLQWMNQQYMRLLTPAQMLQQVTSITDGLEDIHPLRETYVAYTAWFETLSQDRQQSIWKSLAERSKTLSEAAQSVQDLLILPEYQSELLVWRKSTKEQSLAALQAVLAQFEGIDEERYTAQQLSDVILPWIAQSEWGNGDVLWPTRFALSGKPQSPSPFECAETLGKQASIVRLNAAIQKLTAL